MSSSGREMEVNAGPESQRGAGRKSEGRHHGRAPRSSRPPPLQPETITVSFKEKKQQQQRDERVRESLQWSPGKS